MKTRWTKDDEIMNWHSKSLWYNYTAKNPTNVTIESVISGVKWRKYEAEKVIYKELFTVTHTMIS